MKTLQVELPVDLVALAKLDRGSGVSQEAAKLIALELFREDEISLGRAAELCRKPLEAFMGMPQRRFARLAGESPVIMRGRRMASGTGTVRHAVQIQAEIAECDIEHVTTLGGPKRSI